MSQELTPAERFVVLRDKWVAFYTEIRWYLHNLDGDTSRAIGRIIQDVVEDDGKETDWPTLCAAKFIKNDPELWHEVANSRK